MWFEIIPPFAIITASVGLPGLGLYWIHYLVLGNVPTQRIGQVLQVCVIFIATKILPRCFCLNFKSRAGIPLLAVTVTLLRRESLLVHFVDFTKTWTNTMWYEILPSFFIITAGLGLPGWGLYHIHNLVLGNHFRRGLLDRWDRAAYQRDTRITGNPYKVAGLESIPDAK